MKKYLSFSGTGFNFLIPTDNIVELFDANASAEALNAVLVGEREAVYWRGVLSNMLDINELTEIVTNDTNECFVVCKGIEDAGKYFILKVKHIHELLDLDDDRLRAIDIQNPALANISNRVCIMDNNEQLFFVLHEFESIFLSLACVQ